MLKSSFLFLLLLGANGTYAEALAPATADQTNRLDYLLVITGEELLRGVYPDAHTSFITRTLHLLGCHCVGSMTVDDNVEDIKQALGWATQKARLVIVTGGLGPTVNDVTRGALAGFTGIQLQEHPEALAELERRFKTPSNQLRANLRRQTLVPVRGTYLKNANGSAVGLVFEPDGAVIVALPGPPRELQPMVTKELVPYLTRRFGVRSPGSTLTLRFVGIGQSQIDQTLHEHVRMPPDVLESSLFEGGRVDFIFALPGDTAADRARLQQIEAKVREHLGEFLYADDGSSLEELVVKRLLDRGASLALVEVGSGGRLTASLSSVKGVERLLASAYVAPTEERMKTTLGIPNTKWSEYKTAQDRARGMASTAATLTDCRWTLAIGALDRSETGAVGVWLAFGSPDDRWEIQRVPMQGSGETAHAQLATHILDRLRRWLK